MSTTPSSSSSGTRAVLPRVILPGEGLATRCIAMDAKDSDSIASLLSPTISPTSCSGAETTLTTTLVEQKRLLLQQHEVFSNVYSPRVGDELVGVVVHKRGEVLRVDVNAPALAELPETAFNGATRRNKPNIDIGDLLLCHVEAVLGVEAVRLSCVDDTGKTWSSGETLYGRLDPGYVVQNFPISSFLKRNRDEDERSCGRRRNTLPLIFSKLGRCLPLESAVGMNRRVYVRGASNRDTLLLGQFLERIKAGLSDAEVEVLLRKMQNECGVGLNKQHKVVEETSNSKEGGATVGVKAKTV
ncbi:unnamed protein product [Amoebophrya sp. A25]|nr:unnamed protein product [Amoebophrya sp. A25]|eukprot:GSA25T00015387001.1